MINLEYCQGGYVRLLEDNLTKDHIYPQSVEKKGIIPGWQKLDFDYQKIWTRSWKFNIVSFGWTSS